jgi:hypothetical protein
MEDWTGCIIWRWPAAFNGYNPENLRCAIPGKTCFLKTFPRGNPNYYDLQVDQAPSNLSVVLRAALCLLH